MDLNDQWKRELLRIQVRLHSARTNRAPYKHRRKAKCVLCGHVGTYFVNVKLRMRLRQQKCVSCGRGRVHPLTWSGWGNTLDE